MEAILNDYLEKIDKYLKPLPVSDRVDIVREIKSEMVELELQGKLSPEQILERLGNPKELAGLLEFAGYLLGFDIPFVVIQLGPYIPVPPVLFVYSIIIGLLLFRLGRGCWKLTLKYLCAVGKFKEKTLTQQNVD